MMTGASALALVLGLVALDDRVREQIGLIFDPHHPRAALTGVGDQIAAALSVVVVAAKHQSLEHAPLVIFALVASVLVIFMFRT
jgi:hypothetical protein